MGHMDLLLLHPLCHQLTAHTFFSPGVCGPPVASLGLPLGGGGGWKHLQPVQALTYRGPSCPGPKEAPPSASFPSIPPGPPTPIPGEGLHPWETQACAFSGSWFSREPWLEGDGRRSPGGRGSGGSRTGNWKGKGVGGPRSSLPPTFLLLPVPSQSWLAGALEAGAWPRRTQCLLRVKGGW